jgi:hypothetical protein
VPYVSVPIGKWEREWDVYLILLSGFLKMQRPCQDVVSFLNNLPIQLSSSSSSNLLSFFPESSPIPRNPPTTQPSADHPTHPPTDSSTPTPPSTPANQTNPPNSSGSSSISCAAHSPTTSRPTSPQPRQVWTHRSRSRTLDVRIRGEERRADRVSILISVNPHTPYIAPSYPKNSKSYATCI